MKQAIFFSCRLIQSIILFAGIVLIAGCKDQKKGMPETVKEDTVLTEAPSESNSNEANELQDALPALYSFNTIGGEVIGIAASEQSEHDPFFLIGDANYIVATKYLDERVVKADTLLKNEFVYTQIDSASIQQKKVGNNYYLLLTARETFKGQAITEKTINFILLDVNSLEHYTLMYEGVSSIRCYECIDGDFHPVPLLDKKPGLKSILFEYANKSKWVYRPATQVEKDARHFINYEQKWNEDNQEDNHLANGHSGVSEPVYSTYYKEDIFKLTAAHASVTDSIENEHFKILSYFRGNILGFDKQKQLYFPIYIESCITGCDKKIRFVSPETIEILYDEYNSKEVYTVQLNKIRF
ncbi:hypothetical protein ACLOAU_22330 [Niabella sp. CJ426]|uniref:hypothetical protein n=1 Tax=Niabella sp. CJ426 TaxID=3393740 RepID=UPI003CFF4C54